MNQTTSTSQDQQKVRKMRVFHGITGAAGQPASIVQALRLAGVDAENYLVGNNKYAYGHDHAISANGDLHATLFKLLQEEALTYDVFHFYFRSFFYVKQSLKYPTGLDLALLRLSGKRVIVNFRGSEVRLHSEFKKHSPFNYVDENPDGLTKKFPEHTQRSYLEFASAICNHILVPDPELQSYVPGAKIVPRSIDLEQWQPAPESKNVRPLVIHAPSRRIVKGSDSIIAAVEELKNEGVDFDFELIEGLENSEARKLYARSDIVVDQLRIGWYGVLAAEGMALRKAVISYIRDDLVHHLGDQPPLLVANPTNIKVQLRKLIEDENLRRSLAQRGLEFCRATHDSAKVAQMLISHYNDEGNAVNPQTVANFLATQHSQHLSLISSIQKKDQNTAKLEKRIAAMSADVAKLNQLRRWLAPALWIRRKLTPGQR